MFRKALMSTLILCLVFLTVSAEEPDYSQLDVTPLNDGHHDIDMFMSNWQSSMPKHTFGSLIERDLLTKSAGDPLKPHTKGAVLTYLKRLTHGMLAPATSTIPSTLVDEQIVFYFTEGHGTVTTKSSSAEVKSGIGILMPPGIEFVISNSGEEELTMYIFAEPLSTKNHKYDDVLFLHKIFFIGILSSMQRRFIMPRKSPYEIVLTSEELRNLEAMARKYTLPYFKVMRAKIVLLSAQGFDNNEIGEKLDLPRQIVSKWRKRFFEKRLAGLHDQPRRGRPHVFSP